MAPSVLLLGLVLSSASALPPRISFLIDSIDRPLVHFSLPDVQNTNMLLLSDGVSTLYVGAQDTILSLDISQSDVIRLKKQVSWRPTAEEISKCGMKGKNSQVDCPNFVHVVQPINSTHLYACGSYAFSPHYAFIDVESFTLVDQGAAKGHCPFSPYERSSAITIDEELYTATTSNFLGNQPQISRYFSRGRRPDVSLDSPISLLSEPTFVSSSFDPEQQKIYFFFNEVGKEFRFTNELRTARVAQVCKDDVGGVRILQKKWTSFAKATLNCQKPKHPPFNVLQDMFTLQPPEGSESSETVFYGIFTSQWSTQTASAVCTFRLKDIRSVFSGAYKNINTLQLVTHPYLGKCGLANSSDSNLAEVRKNFLTSRSVNPVGQVVVSSEQKYSRVVVMRTQAANSQHYNVLFLLTETGFLHKMVLLDQGPWIIEEIQVFTQPQVVRSMVLSASKGVLYVGTSAGVTAVSVARCSTYQSCGQCLLARDPLCGWSRTTKVCTSPDAHHQDLVQNLESRSVEEDCQEENKPTEVTAEVGVHLNEAVKLPCVKSSNRASLTWTFSQSRSLPENLFIHSADGSLRFLASSRTSGTYSCEAEEDGFREVVVSYNVRLFPNPRHLPRTEVSQSPEESFEDIETQEPTRSSDFIQELETKTIINRKQDSRSENTEVPGDHMTAEDLSTKNKSNKEGYEFSEHAGFIAKSYHSELVVVSFLLAACLCVLVLGFLHTWRQKKTDSRSVLLEASEFYSKTNASTEICSLSSPENAGPDQTVTQ
ncbi:semaphorin-4B isoform X1 [Nothobranchius furzeri]|uniref:Transcript variant X1 n=1 Tax=Nothobranchius furzeri TaxID=105023 RepID=A0A9D2YVB9_NOTFU|nr:transcript variant X1 [Nothobranchius furzeri]